MELGSTFQALTARLGGKETSVLCSMEGDHPVPWPEKEAMTSSVRLLQKANRWGAYRNSSPSRGDYHELGIWAAKIQNTLSCPPTVAGNPENPRR